MRDSSTDGFTLLELLIAIVIAGILASIAAPGWLSFINRQRANAMRDEMLQIVLATQTDAQRNNKAYEISFDSSVGSPALIVAQDDTDLALEPANTAARTELGDVSNRDKLSIQATDANGVDIEHLVFDHNGQIVYTEPLDTGGQIRIPIVINSMVDGSNIPNRCIVFTTLLGDVVTGEGDDCDNPNYIPVP